MAAEPCTNNQDASLCCVLDELAIQPAKGGQLAHVADGGRAEDERRDQVPARAGKPDAVSPPRH